MNSELLSLRAKRFLCPYCGEWHEWNTTQSLEWYDSDPHTARFECPDIPGHKYEVSFGNNYCIFRTERLCRKADISIRSNRRINLIAESEDAPIVTFVHLVKPISTVGSRACSSCEAKDVCNVRKLADKNTDDLINITFGFEFDRSEYEKVTGKTLTSTSTSSKQETKEDKIMNSIFNLNNVEFGPNKDENIASTLMGVAVKNGDSWRIYDKSKKEITDVGNMQLGNLPIFILPTTELEEGDLIKDDGEYYFVMKMEEGTTQTLHAKTGEMKTVIPIKNVLGFSCYSKVIALSDSFSIGEDFDVEKLALMSAMCGQSGQDANQMNQLLPLMIFKDKLGGDDDMMKMLLVSSMAVPANGENQNAAMNQLLPLMFLKNKNGGDDDMMKMLLMSSMMVGNAAGNNNPVMSYLMLDMFMGKKNKKNEPQKLAQIPAEAPASEASADASES